MYEDVGSSFGITAYGLANLKGKSVLDASTLKSMHLSVL